MTRAYWGFLVQGASYSPLSPARRRFIGFPGLSAREKKHTPSLYCACGPGHLRASLTCFCSFSCGSKPLVPKRLSLRETSRNSLFSRQESRSLLELTRQVMPTN
ncbi:hypothetical protein NPIL_163551 [Nephila pilipes]|uniref:Uncharacterized protein n=1 Tax=Nephila pilipes TaxID=299642 RepID=A0A8X6MSA3_NEPPI|nr:hypothetical protein NPIL_163551 [Nephila pilipes]